MARVLDDNFNSWKEHLVSIGCYRRGTCPMCSRCQQDKILQLYFISSLFEGKILSTFYCFMVKKPFLQLKFEANIKGFITFDTKNVNFTFGHI